MKINGEKIKEAKRLQWEFRDKYAERAKGVKIASEFLPPEGAVNTRTRSCIMGLQKATETISWASQRMMDFPIYPTDFNGETIYEIEYDGRPIETRNEFKCCRDAFMGKVQQYLSCAKKVEWLVKDGKEEFLTDAKEFLDKLEEAFEE